MVSTPVVPIQNLSREFYKDCHSKINAKFLVVYTVCQNLLLYNYFSFVYVISMDEDDLPMWGKLYLE